MIRVFAFRFAATACLLAFAQAPLAPAAEGESPPPGYYDRTFGLTGGALEHVLHDIIREHTVQPYTRNFQFDAWDALKVLDRDPDDASRVIEVFSGASVPADDTSGGGNPEITEFSWEREHLWPRSYGAGNTAGAAFSDLFNLRPINQQVNQTRGNRIFDDPAANHPSDPAVPAPGAPECLYDAAGVQGRLWAPRPVEKAEIARAMFYMQVRYDGRDQDTVNLRLGDDPETGLARFGRLGTLLEWHRQEPVSDAELRRNGLIFTEYQGNRNPFVDDPDFADRVFSGAPPPTGLNLMLCRPVVAMDDGPAAMTGVVALSEPAVADTLVTLEPGAAFAGLSVPESVTVGTGESTAVFTVDATAAGPPSFDAFRASWTLTASAADFGTDAAGVTLLGAGGRGWETFDRLLIYGNAYRDGSFIGENGIRWHYTHATSQQNFPIQGRGILLRNLGNDSRIISDPIPGGINRLAVSLRKAFTGTGDRQVEVRVNGISRGFSPPFGSASGASDTLLTYVLDDLQIEGDFTLEIRNAAGLSASRQLVVDDIRWTGWPAGDPPAPELAAFPDRLPLPGYSEETGPGEEVRFRLFGTRLGAASLIAEAPAGFEIAIDDGPFATTLDLPDPDAGLTAVFLRARLMDGLPIGSYSGSLIVVGGGGAGPLEVALSGSVLDSASVTLPGLLASGYQQDFSGFAATSELPFGWEVVADGSASNRHDISAWGNSSTGIKRGSVADPLLGYQHTMDTGNAVMRVDLENRSGQTVRALDIQYTGRAERLGLTRYPEFATRVNGTIRPALAYDTTAGNGILKRERFGGLSIPPGGVLALTWTSDRGPGSGSSRQIGLSALNISLPAPPVVTLNGPDELWIEQGSGFIDPGASAEDEFDGTLPVTISGQVNPAESGVVILTYNAVNSVGLAADPAARTVTVLTPFDYLMQITYGLPEDASAPDANPSGDGVVNLMKFALGGDPLVADRSVLPELVFRDDNRPGLRFHTGPELFWDAEASALVGAGLEISLERSPDLTGWNPAAADLLEPPATNVLPAGSGIVISPQAVPEAGPLFLRLMVRLTDD